MAHKLIKMKNSMSVNIGSLTLEQAFKIYMADCGERSLSRRYH